MKAKSKLPAGMGKNNTVVYTEEGDKIKVTVDGTDKDGKPTHSVWVGKFDGKAYPIKGNLAYNSVGYRVINDHTNAIQALKDGKILWSGTITVAKDGKSRTVTIRGTGANGKGGTVFKLSPSGGTYTLQSLYDFCQSQNCLDGSEPTGRLTLDKVGNIYGTTPGGGSKDTGVVFQIVP